MKKRRMISLIVIMVLMLSVHNFGSTAATPPAYIVIKNLVYSVTLEELDLSFMNLTNADIQVLSYMKNLKQLNLSGNNISDLTPLSGLTNLESIDLIVCNITNLYPLRNLTKLKYLSVGHNYISDISVVSNLSNLESFHVSHNNISDVSALRYCTALKRLDISYNNISDISALNQLYNLEHLSVTENNISGGVNFLINLRNLRYVLFYYNPINREILELINAYLSLQGGWIGY